MIREKYKRSNKGAFLPIFCVSNTEYDKHLAGYPVDDPPQLSLDATGISELRNFIQSLPSQARFNTLESYLTWGTELALKSIECFCTDSVVKLKGDVTASITTTRSTIPGEIAGPYADFVKDRLDTVEKQLDGAENTWINFSMKKCDAWVNDIKPVTYLAILRKHGCHISKAAGTKYDWNEILLSPVRITIDKIFDKLRSEWTKELGNRVGNRLSSALRDLIQKLKGKRQYLSYKNILLTLAM